MSKLIVDMEMPRNCQECPLSHAYFLYGSKYCGANGVVFEKEHYKSKRPDRCPIKGVLPDEHGDLIDADAIWERTGQKKGEGNIFALVAELYRSPVIIPAERSEHENP